MHFALVLVWDGIQLATAAEDYSRLKRELGDFAGLPLRNVTVIVAEPKPMFGYEYYEAQCRVERLDR